MSFFSVQNYTTYSILSGVKEPKFWAKRAAELGYPALGICDKQTMAGIIEFQQACIEHGIKPLLGCEFLVFDYAGGDKELRQNSKKIGHLLLYVKNEKGFENLIYLNNYSHDTERGFYYRPRVSMEVVAEKAEGLVCIVPSEGGVGTKFESNRLSKMDQLLELSAIFGDDLYIGINPMIDSSSKYALSNQALANDEKVPFKKIYTFDCHYPLQEEKKLYSVVRQMDNGRNKKCLDRDIQNAYLPTLDEVLLRNKNVNKFLDHQDFHSALLQNMEELILKCEYQVPLGVYYMPQVQLETDSLKGDIIKFLGNGFKLKLNPEADFKELQSLEELEKYSELYPHEHLVKSVNPERLVKIGKYIERLRYEFEIIEKMGYLDYFHIIHDICRHNQDRGWARGSAAGSLLSYLLNITDVDPIYHDLFFERFLSVDRKDLPDIDLDFSSASIAITDEYVKNKYGVDRVAPIITYSRLKVASGIKDIARSFSYTIPNDSGDFTTYDYGNLNDQIKVPYVRQTARGEEELEERLQYENFANFYGKHSKWFNEVILPLQETVTNDGIHAAGTIITNRAHDECLPLKYNSKNSVFVSQWKDKDCEKRGYPKFDFLTIDALDVVNRARQLVEKRHGIKVPHRREIPLDDKKTIRVFNRVMTDGIFQFNTFAQRQYLQKMKPTSFDDLVAAVALVRPGPMLEEVHTEYAQVKNGERELVYDHQDLVPILEKTYGFMIYQEQMMEIVKLIGGLTAAEAEHVRRACGKKKIDDMKKWESVFKNGAFAKGYEFEMVERLWEKIVKFAEYSFNKSHSVSYTLLSWEQAYIKARWPVEYWAASLNFSSDDSSKDNSAVNIKYQAVEEGIEFIYPTIFAYSKDFEPYEEGKIIWPLNRIKGIGTKAVEDLCKGGRNSFSSIEEMFESCDKRLLSKTVFEALITAGFFDPICKPWEAAKIYYRLRNEPVPYNMSHRNLFKWHKLKNEAFGMIVTPWKDIAPFHSKIQRYPGVALSSRADGKEVFIGGYVSDLKTRKTKKGSWYGVCTLVDDGEEYRIMLWSPFWENERLDIEGKRPKIGQLVELIGKKESFNDRPQVTINNPNSYVNIVWDESNFER
jgi:DNA polymerase-3 subunit alpha